ncbi:hypothetical protein WR25_27222 [Diploscapter pachys]|uniref:Uncharacterized protein n=1 Tax=Diploscapter pachys TaxID=2018661 RepID=A0A2A2JS68_9BILA|nr:hypothetical protein WR25_27222 [Diploscapter pachys]
MFDKLLQTERRTGEGLQVVQTRGNASDLPMQLHHVARAISTKRKMTIVTARYTEFNYKLMASKLAIRWDPNLIRIIELQTLYDGFEMDGEELIHRIDEDRTLTDKSSETRGGDNLPAELPSIIYLEDVTVLERLGVRPVAVALLIMRLFDRMALTFHDQIRPLLIAGFEEETQSFEMLKDRCNVRILMETIGGGFDKTVTGKIKLWVRNNKLHEEPRELLYLVGERSIKDFHFGIF